MTINEHRGTETRRRTCADLPHEWWALKRFGIMPAEGADHVTEGSYVGVQAGSCCIDQTTGCDRERCGPEPGDLRFDTAVLDRSSAWRGATVQRSSRRGSRVG